MKYEIVVKPKLKKLLKKPKYKNKANDIYDKMDEIATKLATNPNHYKNLNKPMQRFKRVHCGSSVLVFKVD